MFELKGHKAIAPGMHIITENKLVLYSDDENDVLYTGSNSYGNRLLGSIMAEDHDDGILRYIHVLATDEIYYGFLNRRITFLQLLKIVEYFFVVDFDYNGNDLNYAVVSIDEIPEEYRPLEDSFCPDFIIEASFKYAASLKGKESDLHKAFPEDLTSINDNFSQFLKLATNFIGEDLQMQRKVYVEALRAGSFQINFSIELTQNNQLSLFVMPTSPDKINSFVKGFADYVLNKLPYENANVFKSEHVESADFKLLEEELKSLYNEDQLPSEGLEQKLIDIINYSVQPLKNINYLNSSFDRVELVNLLEDGSKVPIGLVNENFIPSIEKKLPKVEESTKEDQIEFDEFPKEYRIQVFSMNKESGTGRAYIHSVSSDGSEKIDNVQLHLKGRTNYAHTIYTKSLDEEIIISSIGLAKRINGKLTELSVRL